MAKPWEEFKGDSKPEKKKKKKKGLFERATRWLEGEKKDKKKTAPPPASVDDTIGKLTKRNKELTDLYGEPKKKKR
jgi:hypothetical protein